MAVEFDSGRDVPLLVVFGAAAAVGMYAVGPLVMYTPLYTGPRNLIWLAAFTPVCVGPLLCYLGYQRGRLRVVYPVLVAVFALCFGVLFFFKSNGAGDTSTPTFHEVEVVSKSYWTAPKGGRNFFFVVEAPAIAPGKRTRVGVGRTLWEESEPGASVILEVYDGARGVLWLKGVEGKEE